MKLEILEDENGSAIGWSMSGENPEEVKKLATVRNLQFFGFNETHVKYDGRTGEHGDVDNPMILNWRQKEHCKET